jgi:hypothetical protein
MFTFLLLTFFAASAENCFDFLTDPDAFSGAFRLVVSTSPDRSNQAQLSGNVLSGGVYVFLLPEAGVDSVHFYLDGSDVRWQADPPFDFAGGPADSPNVWSTQSVADGSHRIAADVYTAAGMTTVSASFTVANSSTPPPPPSGDLLPAFPGAEGWGAMALNDCRSLPLRVHLVTNRNDSGAGSFRSAIDATSSGVFDVIVFRTGGTITLRTGTELRANCVYLAGQTAPGGGILVRMPDVGGSIIRIFNNNNLVVRYVRLRHGLDYAANGNQHCDGCGDLRLTGTGGAHRVIYDHISTSWAMDGNFGYWRTDNSAPHTREITAQRSISAEAWREHSTGVLIGGRDSEDAGRGVYQISVHHNLFANTGQRNPEVEVGDAENYPDRGIAIINNVQYNWTGRPVSGRKQSVYDIVNNYSKPGPATGATVHRHMYYNDAWPAEGKPDPSIYITGNIMEGESFSDQWDMMRDWYDLSRVLPTRMHRSTRLSPAPIPVTVQSANEAYNSVLADVGANKRLTCDGGWVAAQDAVDARIINQVQTNTGPSIMPENVNEAGGWPAIAAGTSCPDADNDGLPDAWEERFFSCQTCANPGAGTASGYLVIEHYLNGTDPH